MFDFSAEKTRASIETSLKRLGVDYIDVIQVHDIEFAPSLDVVVDETLPVLEEAVRQGKARFIGVTGYPVATLKECMEKSKTKIDAVLSYARLTLFDGTLKEYLPFFQVDYNTDLNQNRRLLILVERSWDHQRLCPRNGSPFERRPSALAPRPPADQGSLYSSSGILLGAKSNPRWRNVSLFF